MQPYGLRGSIGREASVLGTSIKVVSWNELKWFCFDLITQKYNKNTLFTMKNTTTLILAFLAWGSAMALPAVNADGNIASVAKRGTESEQCDHIGCMDTPPKANTVSTDATDGDDCNHIGCQDYKLHGDCNHIGCPGYKGDAVHGDCNHIGCPGHP